MSKRKRDEAADDEGPTNSVKSHKQELTEKRLRAVIEDGIKELARALKIAKNFERQKLWRRQKQALEKRSTELSRLDEEIAIIQDLNFDVAAKFYVYRTLARIKSIATSPDFPADILSKGRGPSPYYGAKGSSAAMNVTARLYNSNLARSVVPGITENVRQVLGVKTGKSLADEGEGVIKSSTKTIHTGTIDDRRNSLSIRTPGAIDDALSTSSGTESEYLKQFESRLADTTSESGSDQNDEVMPHEDSAMLDTREGYHSQTPESDKQPKKATLKTKTKRKERDKSPIKATTFLPSLAMGGYWSGSESEPNTSDEEAAKIQPKRNRRGQRARQAIWEQKFGSGANHVQKQRQSRDDGWDPRKGAKSRDGARGSKVRSKPKTQIRDRGNPVMPTGANSDPVNKKGGKMPQDDKKLHPSWEAARRQKEEKKTVAFQGKKVIFD